MTADAIEALVANDPNAKAPCDAELKTVHKKPAAARKAKGKGKRKRTCEASSESAQPSPAVAAPPAPAVAWPLPQSPEVIVEPRSLAVLEAVDPSTADRLLVPYERSFKYDKDETFKVNRNRVHCRIWKYKYNKVYQQLDDKKADTKAKADAREAASKFASETMPIFDASFRDYMPVE